MLEGVTGKRQIAVAMFGNEEEEVYLRGPSAVSASSVTAGDLRMGVIMFCNDQAMYSLCELEKRAIRYRGRTGCHDEVQSIGVSLERWPGGSPGCMLLFVVDNCAQEEEESCSVRGSDACDAWPSDVGLMSKRCLCLTNRRSSSAVRQ